MTTHRGAAAGRDHPTGWRRTSAVIGAVAAALMPVLAGLVWGRPDVAVLGFAPVVWVFLHLRVRSIPFAEITAVVTSGEDPANPVVTIETTSSGEMTQVMVRDAHFDTHSLVLAGDTTILSYRAAAWHSGPTDVLVASAIPVTGDGALVGTATRPVSRRWYVAPASSALRVLPTPPRVTGLHGSHEGRRPGSGGEFRDIHPYAPGDELRRVDWRVTARLARSPGELFVRRTQTLSEASAVIVIDTADDLSEAVALWGSAMPDPAPTSLDVAREAARTIAETTVSVGDRVSLIELALRGRFVRSGSGPRQVARIVAALSAIEERSDSVRLIRVPPMPHGSSIYLLSTFFDGDATRLALEWASSGHRVIGIDVLPEPDLSGLTENQRLAYGLVRAERAEVLRALAGGGVAVMHWDEASVRLGVLERTRR